MLEKMDSLVGQVNATPTVPPRLASSSRTATEDDLRRLWHRAVTTGTDDWDYGEYGDYDVPARSLSGIVQHEIDRNPQFTVAPADVERLLVAAEKEQVRRDGARRDHHLREFNESVGPRFASATLKNYEVTLPEQRKVVDAVRGYATAIKARVAAGEGIILFGTAGTGKTHLLCAVGKIAIEAGLMVEWTNGQDLFARFRAAIDGNESESQIIRQLVAPDVLILDDVLPPGGAPATTRPAISTESSTRVLPVSADVGQHERGRWDRSQRGMAAQVVDRLRHGALTVFCNWPSYRRAQA